MSTFHESEAFRRGFLSRALTPPNSKQAGLVPFLGSKALPLAKQTWNAVKTAPAKSIATIGAEAVKRPGTTVGLGLGGLAASNIAGRHTQGVADEKKFDGVASEIANQTRSSITDHFGMGENGGFMQRLMMMLSFMFGGKNWLNNQWHTINRQNAQSAGASPYAQKFYNEQAAATAPAPAAPAATPQA